MVNHRITWPALVAAQMLGACYWTAGAGPDNLMLLRQQEIARGTGLPALDIALDVSEGFTLDGGTIRVLDKAMVDTIRVEILVPGASESWQATQSFDVTQEKLRQIRTFLNLDAGIPMRLRAKLFGKTPGEASTIIGDENGQTLDLPPLSYSKRLNVEWTIPLPGGDLASPSITLM